MWENFGAQNFATEIPRIFAEKVDRNVWVISTREPKSLMELETA